MTKGLLPRIHVFGDWDESQVRTMWGDSSHSVPGEASRLIDRAWGLASARPGVNLFDGPMCRLEGWSKSADKSLLELLLSRTSYKLFLGTNMCHPELADRFGPQVLANPVGVSSALETIDGFLMLGRRNSRVAYYPGRVHPFAGSLEPSEGDGGGAGDTNAPGVFAAVRRELSEEVGFATADVLTLRCIGIAEDISLRQPELIFRVRSALTRSQIESRVARDEHHGSWSVPASPSAVGAALADPELTPVAIASLLLWGRIAFGMEWFKARHVFHTDAC